MLETLVERWASRLLQSWHSHQCAWLCSAELTQHSSVVGLRLSSLTTGKTEKMPVQSAPKSLTSETSFPFTYRVGSALLLCSMPGARRSLRPAALHSWGLSCVRSPLGYCSHFQYVFSNILLWKFPNMEKCLEEFIFICTIPNYTMNPPLSHIFPFI